MVLSQPVLSYEKYSSLKRLLWVTALVLKFVQVLQSKVKPTDAEVINSENIQEATTYWIQKLQIPLLQNLEN